MSAMPVERSPEGSGCPTTGTMVRDTTMSFSVIASGKTG